jgi:hypothetical protein
MSDGNRRRVKELATEWALSMKALWDFSEKAKKHRHGTKAQKRQSAAEQKLDEERERKFEAMEQVLGEMPFKTIDEDGLCGNLMAIVAVGSIASKGYDRDSMFDWQSEFEENVVNTLLEEAEDGDK